MVMIKNGCACNSSPPSEADALKPNYYPQYVMDYRKPYSQPKHDMDCKPYPKHETETILKCGMGISPGPLCTCGGMLAGDASGSAVGGGGYQHHNPVVASVVIDTRNLKDPTVKIDFSSLISFKACGCYSLRLAFKLSKICDGGSPVPLGIWTFEKAQQYPGIDPAAVENVQIDGYPHVQETDPFCFTWCQCEGCPGCCTYLVELIDQDCYYIEFATIGNIFITGMANGIKK